MFTKYLNENTFQKLSSHEIGYFLGLIIYNQ